MAIVLKRVSRLPFAPIVAGLFALAAAVLVMATPAWLLEAAVGRLGIDSVLAAAAPPLGAKARAMLAIVAALGTGAVLWLGLAPMTRLLESKRKSAKFSKKAEAPIAEARVLDAAPEASVSSRRRPIFADRELGAPFMSEEALMDAPLLQPQHDTGLDADELVLDHPIIPPAAESAPFVLEAPEGYELSETVEPFGDAFRPEPFHVESSPVEKRFELKVPMVDDVEPVTAPVDFAAVAPSIPVPPPADYRANESIDNLVTRLENGLARRAAAIAAAQAAAEAAVAVQAVHQAAPQEPNADQSNGPLATAQKEVDSALRQALNTLERLAAGSR